MGVSDNSFSGTAVNCDTITRLAVPTILTADRSFTKCTADPIFGTLSLEWR